MMEQISPTRRKPTGRSKKVAGVLLLLTLLGILGYEISRKSRIKPAALRIPIVRTVEIAESSVLETKSYPGIAKETQIAKLSFRVSGKLLDSEMKVGRRISKDGIVARLDPRDYLLAVQRLEAELQASESLFSAMKTGARPEDLASLKSQLAAAESALATTETNFKRFSALLDDQVASQAQYDLAKTQYDTAKGQHETLQNELEKAQTGARKEDIEAMRSKILGIRSGLETARNALEDTTLKAPFDGMIVEKFIEDYEVVAPGIPIVSFISASQIDVALNLPEETIIRLDDIQGYRVEFEAFPRKIFPAELQEIGLAIQRGRQSYPMQVRVDLPQSEAEGFGRYSIFPGMAATVLIDLKRAPSSTNDLRGKPQLVPLVSLVGQGDETSVWVVERPNDQSGFRVGRRSVQLIRVVGDSAEIKSDLKPSEKIVAAGARFLTDGQAVRLENNPVAE